MKGYTLTILQCGNGPLYQGGYNYNLIDSIFSKTLLSMRTNVSRIVFLICSNFCILPTDFLDLPMFRDINVTNVFLFNTDSRLITLG